MGQMILTIDTQSPEDRKYVNAIARILTELYPDNPPRPAKLSEEESAQIAKMGAELREDIAAMLTPSDEPGPILSPKQLQAAKARQAKADKAAKLAAEAETAIRLAAAEAASDARIGNGRDAFDDEEPEPSTSLSPAEALDAGVALIRRVYQAGHTDEVRDITKKWGVVKFREIPVERGHDFHREIVALADRLGVR